MSYFNQIATRPQDSGAIDAFGRQRISSLVTLFDGKLLGDSAPFLWDDQEVSGTGTTSTYLSNQSTQEMAVAATTAGARLRQTFRRFGYQAGKSHYIMMTTNFRGAVAGVAKEVGYFNDGNGIFFRLEGTGMSLVRRTSVTGSPVDNVVAQSAWNVDKMDGTGPSGVTVDWAKTQILVVDLEWLGVGRVRIGLVIDGHIFYVHYMNNANNLDTVYMTTPNLNLGYRIENDGTGAAATLDCICGMVATEEGREPVGTTRGVISDPTLDTLSNTLAYALINLRLKAGYEDAIVQLLNFGATSDSTAAKLFYMFGIVNGTISNPTTWTSVAGESVEVMLGDVNTTITGGRVGFAVATTARQTVESLSQDQATLFGADIAGNGAVISLVIRPITNNIDLYAYINWRELA